METVTISNEEREAIRQVYYVLSLLDTYVNDFGSAVLLFDFCEWTERLSPGIFPSAESWPLSSWKQMAARDATMTVFHFSETMDNVKGLLRSCPTLSSLVDHKELRIAGKVFRSKFPSFVQARNAMAHSADLATDAVSTRKEAFTGTHSGLGIRITRGEDIAISQMLDGRIFKNTVAGILTELVINHATLDQLIKIRDRIFKTFSDASSAIDKMFADNNKPAG